MKEPAKDRGTVLIVDDEPGICDSLSIYLRGEGYETHTSGSAEEALQVLEVSRPDIALVDYRLPGMDGLSLLKRMRSLYPDVETVLITAFGDVDTAIQAAQDGAYAYLPKPFDLDEIGDLIRRTLENVRIVVRPSERIPDPWYAPLAGESDRTRDLRERIAACARSRRQVLIVGEIGSGREAAARLLHSHLVPHAGPLRRLPCGALESGEFQEISNIPASGESVFLFFSELAELDPSLREILFRSMTGTGTGTGAGDHPFMTASLAIPGLGSTGHYPVSIIHAAGKHGWEIIEVPPLRERTEDLPHLAAILLARVNADLSRTFRGIDQSVMNLMEHHPWTGNVRELENVIRSAALATRRDVILPESLPSSFHEGPVAGSSTGRDEHAGTVQGRLGSQRDPS